MIDLVSMSSTEFHIRLNRVEHARNMARFYAMSLETDLFGAITLIRRWGRIGSTGRSMVHSFERERDAVELFLKLLKAKRSRGYRRPSAHHPKNSR